MSDNIPAMPVHQREFFLYSIASGVLDYKCSDGILKVYNPTVEVRKRAALVYEKVLNRAKRLNLISEKDLVYYLIDNCVWSEQETKILDSLPKEIENAKIDLYKNFYTQSKKYIKAIETLEQRYTELLAKRHAYDYVTIEGVANFAKWIYIIENSTFCKGRKYKWHNAFSSAVLNTYYESLIDDRILRQIARSSPWDIIWSTNQGKGLLKVYNGYTLNQQKLISWSKFYDNVANASESPSNEIVECDYALDGWVIFTRRQREKDITTREINDRFNLDNNKEGNQEIFLVAKNQDEANKIFELNDIESSNIVRSRFKQIAQENEVNEVNLRDVRRNIQMQFNRMGK